MPVPSLYLLSAAGHRRTGNIIARHGTLSSAKEGDEADETLLEKRGRQTDRGIDTGLCVSASDYLSVWTDREYILLAGTAHTIQ